MDLDIEAILTGNMALGLVLILTLVLLGYANRSFLRDMAADPEASWRVLAWAALVISAAFIAWTTLMDNWRQLIGLPYQVTRRFDYQRVVISPPPGETRAVTMLLLALSLVIVACLVARHVGGYGLQLAVLPAALIGWAPLFALRQRLDSSLVVGFGGDVTAPLDVLAYAAFLIVAWLFAVALIFVSYAVLLMAVALPVTLFLDLIRCRRPRPTDEATAFFTALGSRARSGETHRGR